ncbi:MAG TPA: o-succinylbenzoate synthase [Anaerolineae bacterium]|nr:o-succinylbenzoate synthase [Anaerolineae bacterium]
MKIDFIELRHIRMRLVAPFETSFGVELDRDCVILILRGEGLTGWGECVAGMSPGYSYETTMTAWHVLTDFFVPAIVGSEIVTVEDLRDRLRVFKGHPLARAGLEMAFWDLLAQAAGKPLATALGGVRKTVPVGVSVGIQKDAELLVDTIGQFIDQGYDRIKIKIKPGRDVDDVQAVRRAFPDLKLQVDANSAYTIEDATSIEALDDYDLLLIEQPLAEDDLIDHSRLQARLKTAICLDESILSVRHARQAVEIDACRIINIKPGRVGGLSEAMAIHNLCLESNIPVWCGGMLETGIGRASNVAIASLPGFTLPGDISASDRYYVEDIADPPFVLNPDSTLDVPTKPGLGVEVLGDRLDRVTLRREAFRA